MHKEFARNHCCEAGVSCPVGFKKLSPRCKNTCTCRATRKNQQKMHRRYHFVPATQYGKYCIGGTISYLTCNHKGYLQKPCLQNDCTKAALFPTCWRGGKQACLLNTPRQAEGLPLGVFWLLHSAEILSRIPPKENPPPDRSFVSRHRTFKMASGIEVLHGRYIKLVLGSLLASLGESLWCLFGHLGWPGVALEGIWLLILCLLGYALCGLGFETLPERKSDDFGTAFCAENIVNNVLLVHLTVSPRSRHFLRFWVARGSHFGCLGPPFWLPGGPWGSHCCTAGVPGRLQKKACPTILHSRYILVENGPKRGPQSICWACDFGDLLGTF